MTPAFDVAALAEGLTEAQREFVLSLTSEWKHWPLGMSEQERAGLRGFGQRGLTEGRYENSGVYQRLTSLGLAVRAHLLRKDQSR